MNVKDIQEAVISCLTNDMFINKVVSRLTERVRDAVVEALSQSLKEAHSRIDSLSGEVKNLRVELQRIELRTQEKEDELEQYQRRNNVRIFGVPEVQGEVTDELVLNIFRETIGVDLPLNSIERSHRVGAPRVPREVDKAPRPRPIIVRFQSHRDRREIFAKKKALKGSGMVLREDLTPRRAEVLRRAVERHGVRKVWTVDGRVVWLDANGKRTSATSLEGLN